MQIKEVFHATQVRAFYRNDVVNEKRKYLTTNLKGVRMEITS